MKLTDLYINDSGYIRRIGENCHDQLTIDKDGKLHYYNLQNGDGCTLGEEQDHDGCFYEFVPNTDEYGYNYDPREEPMNALTRDATNMLEIMERTANQPNTGWQYVYWIAVATYHLILKVRALEHRAKKGE